MIELLCLIVDCNFHKRNQFQTFGIQINNLFSDNMFHNQEFSNEILVLKSYRKFNNRQNIKLHKT
jgi:hypothetical protein